MPFLPMSLLSLIFGPGLTWSWKGKATTYGKKESVRLTPWLWGDTTLYTRSPEVMRQIAGGGSNHTWIKPEWASAGLMIFGKNLISENLEGWRRHRRVLQPAFNNKTYELVWHETERIYHDMVQTENWNTKNEVSIPSVSKYTLKVGLYTIISCGFGLPFTWSKPPKSDVGHASIQQDIEMIENYYILLAFAPWWLWKLPLKKLKVIKACYDSFRQFILGEVSRRRSLIQEALRNGDDEDTVKQDVFSRLILANETEGKHSLSDEELMGNTFALLLAGHDTTAHTLAACLGLLAVHPEEQEKVHKEIVGLHNEYHHLGFEHYGELSYTLSAFLEAVRLYPAGWVAIRIAVEDTVLRVPTQDDTKVDTVPLPKDSITIVDVLAAQYNPRVYEDPYSFKPSRWLNCSEDNISAFSIGPRTCIGKRFAMTEAVCFLANILRDWEVHPLLKEGETVEQWKERVLTKVDVNLILSIVDAPVKLVRRGPL
ncbi:cytochrome P450 [Serendipita vermifera]|nr:cytochrome P450 [Serendipita vermifera]